MTKVKVFFEVGQNSRSRSLGQKILVPMERSCQQRMYIWNMKALPLLVRKLWPRLKFFKSRSIFKVKVTRSKIFGTHGKVLSQGMYICNMKVLTLLVRKLWLRLKFFKSRSNVKVTRSKLLVPIERSCHKECTYVIWKPYLFWLGSYDQG